MSNRVYVFNSSSLDIDDFSKNALKMLDNVSLVFINGGSDKLNSFFAEKGIKAVCYENIYQNDDYIDDLIQTALTELELNNIAIISREQCFDELVCGFKDKNIELINIQGFGICDSIKNELSFKNGLKILRADGLKKQSIKENYIIYGINSLDIAKHVKDILMYSLNSDFEVNIFEKTKKVNIKLSEIDKLKEYHDYTSLAVISDNFEKRYYIDDLLNLMRFLRSENGCPWDREQTHKSLRKYLIEEAYEAALAIDGDSANEMVDEFGDVLLQLALHSVIGEEEASFNFNDISTAIYNKMYSRHRHIFGNDRCDTAEAVSDNWQKIKKEEKKLFSLSDELDNISKGLPALLRAEKIQKKVSKIGYDFENVLEALEKVHEEANELKLEIEKHGKLDDELGDLFFSCVNVSRLLGIDAENVLSLSTEKFIKRVKWIENKALTDEKSLNSLTSQEKSVYWYSSKVDEN